MPGFAALLLATLPLQTPVDSLRPALEERIRASGATVGIYFRDLARPDSLDLGADRRFHAASTMKIAVMIQVFRDIDARRLRLNDRLTVRNSFRSIVDSSEFTLSAGDDSDSTLYRRIGQEVTVEELVRLMITVSSNLATNVLVERVGAGRIAETMRALGADAVQVLRGVEDGAAFRAGRNNTATARGLGILLASLANAEAATANSSSRMLDILQGQRFKDAIPAGLPRRTRIAHKTGTLNGAHHDAALVYLRGDPRYILVVMTQGLDEQPRSAALIADLARLVHAHVAPPEPPPPRRQ